MASLDLAVMTTLVRQTRCPQFAGMRPLLPGPGTANRVLLAAMSDLNEILSTHQDTLYQGRFVMVPSTCDATT